MEEKAQIDVGEGFADELRSHHKLVTVNPHYFQVFDLRLELNYFRGDLLVQ